MYVNRQALETLSRLLEEGAEAGAGASALICGPSGSGKTLIATEAARAWGANHTVVECSSLFAGERGEAERRIFSLFGSLVPPCVLVLDGVDLICPRGGGRGVLRHICSAVLEAMDFRAESFMVLATAPSASAVDVSLLQRGRLGTVVELRPPSEEERLQILALHARGFRVSRSSLEVIAGRTHGLLGSDLAHICREAAACAIEEGPEGASVSMHHFERALRLCRPVALIDQLSTVRHALHPKQSPAVVGCHSQIATLRRSVVLPLMYPEALMSRGLRPPGVLLYGPPGCGKTLAASAIAAEVAPYARFLPVQCASIVDKVVGKSEEALSAVFRAARSCAPCLVFLDQVESIASVRGHHSSTEQTFDRLLSTLLVEMDGARSNPSALPVIVMAATNDPSWLDPALLRAGRVDCHVHFDLPGISTRADMFLAKTNAMPLADEPEVLASWFAERTEGWSAADVAHACREAAMAALREDVGCGTVMRRHFEVALSSHAPAS
jgi:SpoVK/Ycf46/Vps4 family AAA+-type ATPase